MSISMYLHTLTHPTYVILYMQTAVCSHCDMILIVGQEHELYHYFNFLLMLKWFIMTKSLYLMMIKLET